MSLPCLLCRRSHRCLSPRARLVLLLLCARLPLVRILVPTTLFSSLAMTRMEGSPWTSPQALARALALVVACLRFVLLLLLLQLLLLRLPTLLVVLAVRHRFLLALPPSSSTQTTRSSYTLPCVVPVLPRLHVLWVASPPPPLVSPPAWLLLLRVVLGASRAITRRSTMRWTPAMPPIRAAQAPRSRRRVAR